MRAYNSFTLPAQATRYLGTPGDTAAGAMTVFSGPPLDIIVDPVGEGTGAKHPAEIRLHDRRGARKKRRSSPEVDASSKERHGWGSRASTCRTRGLSEVDRGSWTLTTHRIAEVSPVSDVVNRNRRARA